MARDALAVLAHMYIRFGRPEAAVVLFGAIAHLDHDQEWALRARTVALLKANRHQEAVTEARRLLRLGGEEGGKITLYYVIAFGCWALGMKDDAQVAYREACQLAANANSPSAAVGAKR